MIRNYKHEVAIVDADQQLMLVDGNVKGEIADHSVFQNVLADVFEKLTQRQAVFGHPGRGCKGPYRIRRLTIEEID